MRLPSPSCSLLGLGLLALAPALAGEAPSAAEAARAASASINEARCRAHVEFLSSDLLEGRATPSRGLDLAASYVASHFARAGLERGGDAGGWFQTFPVPGEARLASSALEGAGKTFAYGTDYIPLAMSGSGKASGALAFAGYGITAPEQGYDDYASIDVKGKVVLVLRHHPNEKVTEGNPFAGRGRRGASRHALFATKIANAAKHGAAAILIVTDPANHEDHKPEGRWPTRGGGDDDAPAIPAFHISLETAQALAGGRDLAALQREIDADLKPRSFVVEGSQVSVAAEIVEEPKQGRNVIGILRGADPALADEAVVIGAHYDHVGVQAEDGHGFPGQIGNAAEGDRIHNGADDNASGTAALLETVRAFTDGGLRPARTIVFIAFAGEELGLIGSRHYVRAPLIPNEKTVAMINLDMVGRNDPGQIFVGGTLGGSLERALNEAAAAVGIKTERMREGRMSGASDHASFQRAGVPTLFLFSGMHPDYHRVSDHADRIVAEKIAKAAQVAVLTAAAVADDPEASARPAPPAREPRARERMVF